MGSGAGGGGGLEDGDVDYDGESDGEGFGRARGRGGRFREVAEVLMTSQMRSMRLIGNSNPRYMWYV